MLYKPKNRKLRQNNCVSNFYWGGVIFSATTTVILACDEGRGLSGNFVHIEDARSQPNFFILCEVEIYILKGSIIISHLISFVDFCSLIFEAVLILLTEAYPCGEPEIAVDSEIVERSEKQVQYSCPKGFKMVGPMVRYCNQSGAWSEHEPACVGKYFRCLTMTIITPIPFTYVGFNIQ